MKRKLFCNRFTGLLLALVFLITATGCAATSNSDGSSVASLDSHDASSITSDTIRVSLPKNVTELTGSKGGLNAFNVLFQIFDMLTEIQEDMSLTPSLATKWEMVDNYTWRFELRDDVTFHDGQRFNAESAKASIDRLVNMEPSYFYLGNWLDSWPPETTVEGEYSILIKTQTPNLKVPEMLSRVIMVPIDYTEHEKFFSENLNGTGAYKFIKWDVGSSITLEANDNYWRGSPRVKNLVFDIITDPSARLSAYLVGEHDVAFDVPYDRVAKLNSDGKHKVVEQELVSLSFIYFNPRNFENSVISNPLIREAMMYAIDSYGIVDSIMYGHANVVSGIANQLAAGSSDDGGLPHRDLGKARDLMQQAGYDNEQILFAFPHGEFNNSLEIGELITAQLQEAGFNIKFQELESGVWSSNYQGKSGWDLAPNNVPGTFTGESDYHWVHTLKDKIGWQSDEIDAILKQAYRIDNTLEQRLDYLRLAMSKAWELKPYLWATECVGLYGFNPLLKGVKVVPLNLLLYRDAYYE